MASADASPTTPATPANSPRGFLLDPLSPSGFVVTHRRDLAGSHGGVRRVAFDLPPDTPRPGRRRITRVHSMHAWRDELVRALDFSYTAAVYSNVTVSVRRFEHPDCVDIKVRVSGPDPVSVAGAAADFERAPPLKLDTSLSESFSPGVVEDGPDGEHYMEATFRLLGDPPHIVSFELQR